MIDDGCECATRVVFVHWPSIFSTKINLNKTRRIYLHPLDVETRSVCLSSAVVIVSGLRAVAASKNYF
jgi:hypothetical protein